MKGVGRERSAHCVPATLGRGRFHSKGGVLPGLAGSLVKIATLRHKWAPPTDKGSTVGEEAQCVALVVLCKSIPNHVLPYV